MNTIEKVPLKPNDKVELSKRCYVPGYVLHSQCPKCGESATRDLGSNYLSYPTVGKPYDVGFCCRVEECQEEWDVCVIVTLSVELDLKPGDR